MIIQFKTKEEQQKLQDELSHSLTTNREEVVLDELEKEDDVNSVDNRVELTDDIVDTECVYSEEEFDKRKSEILADIPAMLESRKSELVGMTPEEKQKAIREFTKAYVTEQIDEMVKNNKVYLEENWDILWAESRRRRALKEENSREIDELAGKTNHVEMPNKFSVSKKTKELIDTSKAENFSQEVIKVKRMKDEKLVKDTSEPILKPEMAEKNNLLTGEEYDGRKVVIDYPHSDIEFSIVKEDENGTPYETFTEWYASIKFMGQEFTTEQGKGLELSMIELSKFDKNMVNVFVEKVLNQYFITESDLQMKLNNQERYEEQKAIQEEEAKLSKAEVREEDEKIKEITKGIEDVRVPISRPVPGMEVRKDANGNRHNYYEGSALSLVFKGESADYMGLFDHRQGDKWYPMTEQDSEDMLNGKYNPDDMRALLISREKMANGFPLNEGM